MIIALRVIHILLGAFWTGTAIFLALFLEPSVRDAGPAGGQVMLQIMKRNYSQIVAGIAAITILSGFGLFWIDSTAGGSLWMATPAAHSYSLGALVAIIALLVGLTVLRPTAKKLVALIASASPGNPPPAAEMQPLQDRLRTASRWVAALVAIAVILMAAARYL